MTADIHELLTRVGFDCILKTPNTDTERYETEGSGIHSVTVYSKGDISIDVVESIDDSPLTPIFRSHSTAPMVFFTPRLVYVAYSDLFLGTDGLHAMINSRVYPEDNAEIIPDQIRDAITKYEQRGFVFAPSSIVWLDHHYSQAANHEFHLLAERLALTRTLLRFATADQWRSIQPFRTTDVVWETIWTSKTCADFCATVDRSFGNHRLIATTSLS